MLTDQFYHALEARFRGTRADIKQRQTIYLPLIKALHAQCDKPGLDVGCGRAEWLELLGEHGIPVAGVDLNSQFADLGRELGLSITNADALEYLGRQPEGSLAFVSAFHVVEHLAFESLLDFLAKAFRAIDEHGLILLETPNPVNLTVGANTFYTDPTHERPIPPGLLAFATEFAGFSSPVIVPMNRGLLVNPLQLMDSRTPGAVAVNNVVHLLDQTLMSSPDYAVIAFKKPSDDYVRIAQSLVTEPGLPTSDDKPTGELIALDSLARETQIETKHASEVANDARSAAHHAHSAADHAHSAAHHADDVANQAVERTAALEERINRLERELAEADLKLELMSQGVYAKFRRSLATLRQLDSRPASVIAWPRRVVGRMLTRVGRYVVRRPLLKAALLPLLAPFPRLRVALSNRSRLGTDSDNRLGTLIVERADQLGSAGRKVHEDLLRKKKT